MRNVTNFRVDEYPTAKEANKIIDDNWRDHLRSLLETVIEESKKGNRVINIRIKVDHRVIEKLKELGYTILDQSEGNATGPYTPYTIKW